MTATGLATVIQVLGLLWSPGEAEKIARARAVVRHSWITVATAAAASEAAILGWRSYGVPPAILFAVVETESGWSGSAVSSRRCRGWTQFSVRTANWIGRRCCGWPRPDLSDPGVAITLTAAYLAELRDHFGSLHHALGAYNSGPARYARWKRNREFTKRVYGALAEISKKT